MARRKTNQQILRQITCFSAYGALAEIFVMAAVEKYAEACAAADPKTFDNALISGAAWQGVAVEIRDILRARNSSSEHPTSESGKDPPPAT